MSSVNRANRKANDDDLIVLNSLGLSLATIAKQFGCHHTTITQRLKALGIDPADTRRSFMEDIVKRMPVAQMEWLAGQLNGHLSVKDFVFNLLAAEYRRQNQGSNTP